MEPSQELPQILDRCRAYGIACPIDLVTARQPTNATLAWLDYVRELPALTPHASPSAKVPSPAGAGAGDATQAAQVKHLSELPLSSEPTELHTEATLADAAAARLRHKSLAREAGEGAGEGTSPLFVWLTVAGALIALAAVGWLAWHRVQPLAAQPAPSEIASALSLLAQHKTERAAAIFRTLLQHDPQRADAHYGLARVYWEQGREEEALAEAQAALRQRESDPETWLMLANAAHGSGHLTLARQAYARTLALAPRHPHAEEIRAALRELDGK